MLETTKGSDQEIMAKKNAEMESVKLTGPTLIKGGWHETGDTVEVYPFQKRHMVDGGYAEGRVSDILSPGEKEQGAEHVLKKSSERDDIEVLSFDKIHEEGSSYGEKGEGVVQDDNDAGESGSSRK